MSKNELRRVEFRLSGKELEGLSTLAAKEGRSIAAQTRMIVRRVLGRVNGNGKG